MVLLNDKSRLKKLFYLTALSVFFSLWAFLLSAPFLRVIRKAFGPLTYWLMGATFVSALVIFKMLPLAVVVATFWMTLGIYNELEQRGVVWSLTGPISVLSGVLIAGLGGWFLAQSLGISLSEQLLQTAHEVVASLQQVNPKVEVDPNVLVQSIPAALVSALIIALGMGLIFESRVFRWMSLPRERVASQLKLLEFRVPDFYVWVAMIAFLFSFENFGVKWLAVFGLNITIVSFVLYFFQGLAVMEVGLMSIRAGVFTRILSYFVFIMQLPMMLSMVGFADYWIDLRSRIRRLKAPKTN